jgi:hypothetical protein
MYIIDKDVWENRQRYNLKDDKKVIIRKIKYLNNKPYLFPVFKKKIFPA